MTPKEQERLFVDMRNTHPGWTNAFVSGYVHGAKDEKTLSNPQPEMVRDSHDLTHYALGYLTGFAIHRGADAEKERWFGVVCLIVQRAGDAD